MLYLHSLDRYALSYSDACHHIALTPALQSPNTPNSLPQPPLASTAPASISLFNPLSIGSLILNCHTYYTIYQPNSKPNLYIFTILTSRHLTHRKGYKGNIEIYFTARSQPAFGVLSASLGHTQRRFLASTRAPVSHRIRPVEPWLVDG